MKFIYILLPVPAIKWGCRNRLDRPGVQAIDVNTNAIRMRARHIERFHTAILAEVVLRDSGIERIRPYVVRPAQQAKVIRRYE